MFDRKVPGAYCSVISSLLTNSLLFSEDGRVVTQMQYLSWPDHGTPDDSTKFVEFVEEVRDMRAKSVQTRQAKTSTVDNIEVYNTHFFTLLSKSHYLLINTP